MPISVENIDDVYIALRCEGDIFLDDCLKANEQIYSRMDKNVSRFQIADFLAATNVDLSSEDLRRIAGQDSQATENLEFVVIAVVAPRDLIFGLARMWEVFADTPGVTTAIFRDLATAQDWIMSMRRKRT